MGSSKQTLRAPGNTMDIVSNSLESDLLPTIAQSDLEHAVQKAGSEGIALNTPIRTLELHKSLPALSHLPARHFHALPARR